MNTPAYLIGRLYKTQADSSNPLRTIVQFILTDFLPNKNGEAIPKSEAENVIRSAIGMPVKIQYDGIGPNGHKNAVPIGPIQRAWIDSDNGSEVVMAEAIIWSDEYEEIDAFLRQANAEQEPIGTSWEIFYKNIELDTSGIKWLQDVIVKGAAIVKDPAYGLERTRILSVAELQDKSNIRTDQIMPESTAATMEDISTVTSGLNDLFILFDEMWYELYEQDRINEATTTGENVLDRAKELLAEWKRKKTSMAETQTTIETLTQKLTDIQAEIESLRTYKTEAENDKLFNARAEKLSGLLDPERVKARRDHIITMSEEDFSAYVADFSARPMLTVAETETRIRIPDTSGSATNDIVSAIVKTLKKDH